MSLDERHGCEAFEEMLVDYADDSLDAERSDAVEAHCARCAACREALAALREIPLLLRGADPIPAADWGRQRDRILTAIDEIVAAEDERRRGFDARLLLPIAAALVIALAGMLSLRAGDARPARAGLAMAIEDPAALAEISETLGEPLVFSETLWAEVTGDLDGGPSAVPDESGPPDLDDLSDEEIGEVEQMLGV